jgi:hypothetical protein
MELAERLRSDDVTEEAVLAYLLHRSNQIIESGGVAIPLSSYWHHGDLERYRAAAAVWAQGRSTTLCTPRPTHSCSTRCRWTGWHDADQLHRGS